MITVRNELRGLVPASLLLRLLVHTINAAEPGETLYNGIVLPRPWPPRLADFPTSVEKDPITPPYLYFYVSGRTGRPGGNKAGTLTTGLATLRRDGFASMEADESGGTLTTRPVRFSGRHLFVNVSNPRGELRVEVLNQAGQVVKPFTTENCIPVTADKTLQPVRWRGVADLSSLATQPVRLRFHLKNVRLYAFWVSPEASGASRGYVAAGGPGFSSNRDLGLSTGRIY